MNAAFESDEGRSASESSVRIQRHCGGPRWALVVASSLVVASLFLLAQSAFAQDDPNGARSDDLGGLGADLKAYVTAPAHWNGRDWLGFGTVVAAVSAAYQYDDRVRAHFITPSNSTGEDSHDVHDAVPAAAAVAGTWLYAALIDSRSGRREAGTMLEAAALGSATSYLLKRAAGRVRPYETADPGEWREGGDSFPSTHVTAAFAIGTVLAESGNDDFRWVRRVLGYGIAVGTAYERLDHNDHWLSDTVAGAGLGFATARFVMHRRYADDERTALSIVPFDDGGLLLSYMRPLP